MRVALMAVVFAAMAWGFHELLLHHAPSVFGAAEEDMSFGWYVPLFSLYVLWSERKKVRDSISSPSWAGMFATIPFIALGFLGARGLQIRFEIVAFVGLLITVPWAFFGKETAKAVLFPAMFLLFCIPLATFLDVVTVHMRLLASSTAFAVAKCLGADIVQKGTMVGALDGSFAIDVADPCSGLRSLFALMALTAGYAYFTQPTWLRRGILFAASVPIAILGNVCRILSIVVVASFASSDFATGFYHDYSGFVIFAVAILLMVVSGDMLSRLFEIIEKDEDGSATADVGSDRAPKAAECGNRIGAFVVPALVFALVVPAMLYQATTPEVVVAEAPRVALGEISGFSSEVLEASEAELTVLPKDTQIFKRRYESADGGWMVVSMVIGGKSKSSIHRPELCLPAQGFAMVNPRTRMVDGRSWRCIDLVAKDSPTFGFAYTFFNQEGYSTASHTARIFRDVVDRSILNRIDRWVMVTVHSSFGGDAEMLSVLSKLRLSDKGVSQ